MIQKIRRLKFRSFRDYTWSSNLPDFQKLNLIYGWNGSGKTTLSTFLGSFITNNDDEFDFELEMTDSTIYNLTSRGSYSHNKIKVFNQSFTEKNIFTSSNTITPIFFLGEGNIRFQRLIEKYKEKSIILTDKKNERAQNKNKIIKEQEKFLSEKAKRIKEDLRSPEKTIYTDYTQANLKKKLGSFEELKTTESLSFTDEQIAEFQIKKSSKQKNILEELTPFASLLLDIETKTIALLSRTLTSKPIPRLKEDSELQDWVKGGLSLYQQRATSQCLFCENQINPDVLDNLNQHFNAEFQNFMHEIGEVEKSIDESLNEEVELISPEALYEDYYANYKSTIDAIKILEKSRTNFLKELKRLLQGKKKNPFIAISYERTQYEDLIIPNFDDEILTIFERSNKLIKKHNERTMNFKSEIDATRSNIENHIINTEILDKFKKDTMFIEDSTKRIEKFDNLLANIERRIQKFEANIIEHRKPAEEMDKLLHGYLGHSQLKFDVEENGYKILRNGDIANHLSEGEKTAIAFTYFIKSLYDKDFDLDNGIVVIDDPVSSLDQNAIFHAYSMLFNSLNTSYQLFVFTHNFTFFRLVKSWFKKSGNDKVSSFYMVKAEQNDDKRLSRLLPLDNLLERFDSEYNYLFYLIYINSKYKTAEKSLEYFYQMPNVSRRFLETFLGFRFPSLADNFTDQFNKILFDDNKKTKILIFTHIFSHKDQVQESMTHDPTLLSETPEVLRNILEYVKVADGAHYDEMLKLAKKYEPNRA